MKNVNFKRSLKFRTFILLSLGFSFFLFQCAPPPQPPEPPAKEIGSIYTYIDNSAGMKGYFTNETEFKTIISDFTVKIDKTIKPISIYFSAKEDKKYSFDAQKFTSDIATTSFANENGFQLHEMLNRYAEKSDSFDISILISDFILSFPDSIIADNREINKAEAPNSLKNNVYSTFSDLKKKGFGTSLYAFKSNFFGTYYAYNNDRNNTLPHGEERPFYILVFADAEILTNFNAHLSDFPSFKPLASSHFGLVDEPIKSYSIISQVERMGEWMPAPGEGIKEIKFKKDVPVQFCVALNLKNLPEYAKKTDYLIENIITEEIGCDIEFSIKNKDDVDQSKLKSPSQIKMYDEATHYIIFNINDLNLPDAKVNLKLPISYDNWPIQWSTMNDKSKEDRLGKTFAFKFFVQGIKEAYESKNDYYIDISLSLKK